MIGDFIPPLRHVGGLCFGARSSPKANPSFRFPTQGPARPGLRAGGQGFRGDQAARRAVRGCLILAVGTVLALWAVGSTAPALADRPIRVGLYVQFEDGSSLARCVELNPADYPPGKEATGLDVLRQSGLDLVFESGGGFGAKICRLGKTGCDFPAEDCFCRCQGNPCQYWAYWYAENKEWRFSSVGATNHKVKDGDVEGWVWGDGKTAPPAEVLAAGICSSLATTTPVPPTPVPQLATFAPASTATPDKAGVRATLQPTVTLPIGTASANPSSTKGNEPSTFIWLVVGLSGVAVVLLGLAYFTVRGRS